MDRLLASPRYGERMAFRWMEAARYGDTNGYQTDGPRDMWRWRDWVIDAFNRNMPFDRFTIEQLAGDLLPDATLEQRIATGFNRNHRTSGEGGIIPEEYRVEYVADRAQTTSTVWLGPHRRLRALPRSQVRSDLAEGLLPALRLLQPGSEREGLRLQLRQRGAVRQGAASRAAAAAGGARREVADAAACVRGAAAGVAEGAGELGIEAGGRKTPIGRSRRTAILGAAAPTRSTGTFIEADGRRGFDYLQPFTFAAWIKPEAANGAILSRAEDYFEGQGHGLYLMDGKIRLHVISRWTDLGMRVETAEPVKLNEWQHVLVTYDGERKASGVHIYVDGEPQEMKILFDQIIEPFHKQGHAVSRSARAAGCGSAERFADARIYKRALTPEEAAAVAVTESVAEIAAMPAAQRTQAQQTKLDLCFLETAAPANVGRRAPRSTAAQPSATHSTIRSPP